MSTNTKYVRIEYTIRPDVDLDEVKREITDFIAAIGAHHSEHRYTSFQLEEDPRRFIHIGELVADAMPPLQAQPFFRSFADFLRARCIRGPEATRLGRVAGAPGTAAMFTPVTDKEHVR